MPADVPAAPGDGVVPEAARQPAGEPVRRAGDAMLPVERPPVAEHQPHERDEIGRRPVTIHEGLAEPDVAARQGPQKEPLVVDRDGRIQVARLPKAIRAVGALHGQRSTRHPVQTREKRRLRPLRQHARHSIPEPVRTAGAAACARTFAYAVSRETRHDRHPFPPQLQRLPVDRRHHARGHGGIAHQRAPDLGRVPGAAFERERRIEADRGRLAGLACGPRGGPLAA